MTKRRTIWSSWAILAGMLPAIVIYAVLGVYPSLATAVFSFTDISGLPGARWHFIGWDNYKEFFFQSNARDTIDSLNRTVVFAITVTLIQNFFALLIAVLLNSRRLPGRNGLRAIVFLPTILGVVVTCYAWVLFFNMDGPASIVLSWFGGFSSFFGSQTAAFPLVIFVQIWMSVGYAMVIYLAGLQAIPHDLYEAGEMDGAGRTQSFWRITIPMLWPTITVNLLLSVIGSLSVVQTILLTTGGANNTSTLAMSVFKTAFGIGYREATLPSLRQGFAAAQSIVLFVMILLATLTVQYFLRRMEKES